MTNNIALFSNNIRLIILYLCLLPEAPITKRHITNVHTDCLTPAALKRGVANMPLKIITFTYEDDAVISNKKQSRYVKQAIKKKHTVRTVKSLGGLIAVSRRAVT